jgi:hypothetical protein
VGAQNLNMNIEMRPALCRTGQCEGSTLNLLVKKIYKNAVVKKENWPKFLEMLDAAFNFSQKKVLLKKM